MAIKLLEADKWKAAAKAMAEQGLMDEGDFLESFGVMKFVAHRARRARGAEEGSLQLEFTISDDGVDRMNDRVMQRGMQTANFKKNPVVLWAHMSWQPPIARAVKLYREKVEGANRTVSIAEFMDRELNPFSYMVYQMCDQGFLNACSVGLKIMKWSNCEDEERPLGLDFDESDLLEWSVVPIPANPRALMRAHELGIDTDPLKGWAEEVLDGGPIKGLTRTEVEGAWAQLSSKAIMIDIKPAKAEPAGKKEAAMKTNKTVDTEREGAEADGDSGAERGGGDAGKAAGLSISLGGAPIRLKEGASISFTVGRDGELELSLVTAPAVAKGKGKGKEEMPDEDDDDEEELGCDEDEDDKAAEPDEQFDIEDFRAQLEEHAREAADKAWSASSKKQGTENKNEGEDGDAAA